MTLSLLCTSKSFTEERYSVMHNVAIAYPFTVVDVNDEVNNYDDEDCEDIIMTIMMMKLMTMTATITTIMTTTRRKFRSGTILPSISIQ